MNGFLAKEVISVKNCANPECENSFSPTRHNQKYCSKECCKVVTNAKIMKQYYERKDRKAGVKRVCHQCKSTSLSRYNEGNICQPCISRDRTNNRQSLLQLVGAA